MWKIWSSIVKQMYLQSPPSLSKRFLPLKNDIEAWNISINASFVLHPRILNWICDYHSLASYNSTLFTPLIHTDASLIYYVVL